MSDTKPTTDLEDKLAEALHAARKRMAHMPVCARINPSDQWKERGSWNFDHCVCVMAEIDSALAEYDRRKS